MNQFTSLLDLPKQCAATIDRILAESTNPYIQTRLHELGFVAGEEIKVVAQAPLGKDPIVVKIGATRFALRRAEAACIVVSHAVQKTAA